jgi:DNA-binding transcriptional ArsR family regulator
MARRPQLEEGLLALETRNRVYAAVVRQPGVHLSEIAREAKLLVTHARYHLDTLVRAELLSMIEDAGFVRYFPRETRDGLTRDVVGRREKEIMGALRRPKALHVVAVLLAKGPSSLAALAAALQRAPPTVSFHVERLVEARVVRRVGENLLSRQYAVSDTALLIRLLTRFPPKKSVVASFIDLFDGLAIPIGEEPGAGGSPTAVGQDTTAPAPDRGQQAPQTRSGLMRAAAWILGACVPGVRRRARIGA